MSKINITPVFKTTSNPSTSIGDYFICNTTKDLVQLIEVGRTQTVHQEIFYVTFISVKTGTRFIVEDGSDPCPNFKIKQSECSIGRDFIHDGVFEGEILYYFIENNLAVVEEIDISFSM